MFIYLFNFLSIPFYDLMIKDKKKIIWLVCVQMFLILALRADTLGPDMRAYSTFYNTWSGYSLGEMIGATRFLSNHEVVYGRESGFVWLCWLGWVRLGNDGVRPRSVGFPSELFGVPRSRFASSAAVRFRSRSLARRSSSLPAYSSQS